MIFYLYSWKYINEWGQTIFKTVLLPFAIHHFHRYILPVNLWDVISTLVFFKRALAVPCRFLLLSLVLHRGGSNYRLSCGCVIQLHFSWLWQLRTQFPMSSRSNCHGFQQRLFSEKNLTWNSKTNTSKVIKVWLKQRIKAQTITLSHASLVLRWIFSSFPDPGFLTHRIAAQTRRATPHQVPLKDFFSLPYGPCIDLGSSALWKLLILFLSCPPPKALLSSVLLFAASGGV